MNELSLMNETTAEVERTDQQATIQEFKKHQAEIRRIRKLAKEQGIKLPKAAPERAEESPNHKTLRHLSHDFVTANSKLINDCFFESHGQKWLTIKFSHLNLGIGFQNYRSRK